MTDEWDAGGLDLGAYLRRVGLAPGAANVETLTALHRAHLAAIPFENLDIALGRGISVRLRDIEAKLVERRRGGYCYEHGLLFAAALERLGFQVDRLLARVLGLGGRPRARTHMALRVWIDGEPWLADVGFGAGLLEPMPLAAGERSRQGGWEFELAAPEPGGWELRERRGDEWATRYGFREERQHPSDVVMANHFTSTFARSPFVGRTVVVRKDEEALHELIDRTLTVTRPDGSADTREIDPGERAAVLRERFGLELSEEELAQLPE
jgi:N-hydroxyarylamine O-acetyltransferase